MTFLLWQFIYLPLILAAVYPLAIQYEKNKKWAIIFYVPAFMLNIWLNFTTLAIYTWDFPKAFEFTFSTRLKRLKSATNWRGSISRVCADYLNFWQKGHV